MEARLGKFQREAKSQSCDILELRIWNRNLCLSRVIDASQLELNEQLGLTRGSLSYCEFKSVINSMSYADVSIKPLTLCALVS